MSHKSKENEKSILKAKILGAFFVSYLAEVCSLYQAGGSLLRQLMKSSQNVSQPHTGRRQTLKVWTPKMILLHAANFRDISSKSWTKSHRVCPRVRVWVCVCVKWIKNSLLFQQIRSPGLSAITSGICSFPFAQLSADALTYLFHVFYDGIFHFPYCLWKWVYWSW